MHYNSGLGWIVESAKASKSNGIFTATVVWVLQVEVVDSLLNMLPDVVAGRYIAAGVLPIEGAPYPGYAWASCRSVNCDKDNGGIYRYTAEYSDANAASVGGGGQDFIPATYENPLLDLPIIRPSSGMVTRSITKDIDDKAILNSAGDPIVQTVEDNTIGFAITANIPYVPAAYLALRNTRNAGPISIGGIPISAKAARFVLPANWVSEPKARNDISYLEFTFELHVDEVDKHDGRPLDAGFRALSGTPEKLVTIVNGDGSEPSEPILLDGEGHVLVDPDPDNAVFLEVKKYPLANYLILPGVRS